MDPSRYLLKGAPKKRKQFSPLCKWSMNLILKLFIDT